MTYKKIAELAGVSVSTVSKVMAGSHEISIETSERILNIIRENNKSQPKYHHDRIGTRVAIIVPEIVGAFYTGQVSAIAAELEKRGIIPCVYIAGFGIKKFSAIIDSVTDSGIDGIISLTGSVFEKPNSPPTVWFSTYTIPKGDFIGTDFTHAFHEALEHLVRLGHNDIGFVGEKLTVSKLQQFRAATANLGLHINERNIFVSNKRFEEIGYEAANYFLKKKSMPTALLCAYDEIAMGAIHAFKYKGINVPEDISVIGINDIPYASYADIPLTTISLINEDAPRLVAELICDRINGFADPQPHHIMLKGKLVVRDTTAPPKASSAI